MLLFPKWVTVVMEVYRSLLDVRVHVALATLKCLAGYAANLTMVVKLVKLLVPVAPSETGV